MHVHKRFNNPSGGVTLVLTAENPDDIWCIYNLLSKGDEITVFTSRKVKKENVDTGAVSQQVKKFNIHLEIERITYACSEDDLQVSGRNLTDNPYVKVGQYHTAEIRPHSKITLTKQLWNSYYNDKLREVTDISGKAEQAFLVLDNGRANLYFLLRYLTKEVFSLVHNIPNRKISNMRYSHHQKALEAFFKAIIQKLAETIDFEITRTVVITGPGFTKNSFYDYMCKELVSIGHSELHRHLNKFIVCGSTSSDRNAITEVMGNEQFAVTIFGQHYIEHNRAVDMLRKRLEANESTISIGIEDVAYATELGAVEKVLLSDELIRTGSTEVRTRVHKLIDNAKSQGARVLYFSDEHVSCSFLRNLTGIVALLRFAIEEKLEQ
ncbi:putative mRNA surveillance protein pelota [Babesia bovis T2Bo]|uniref:Protein pelota homolog n=1 Tax=Babesia bovis TaxID=5865 RepID=A7AP76_BABBO|nr:putative mRNA surveillance protein pelota [Babesia bovis T2Bo]EDO08360.1 putative mRNA surveillance protein pelota [Babesia bovis T2Bo]|eukprot:XP_001611928.1 eRF1 domain 3 family protein [Babesia bovis T2Bo]